MSGILGLVSAALFVGMLASKDSDQVKHPKSQWDDTVAKRISGHANQSIDRYNKALKEYKDDLSRVKTKVESLHSALELKSEEDHINWQVQQVEKINVQYTLSKIEKILGD